MTLQRAESFGGDFLDLKEIVRNGPQMLVFRIVEFHPPEAATGFAGTNVPVTADVFIATGPRTGEVHLGEKFIGAICAPLRGVKNPNPAKGVGVLAPVNKVGAKIVARVKLVNAGKSNEGAVGDQPSDAEYDAVAAAYEAAGGDALWDTPTPSVGAVRQPHPEAHLQVQAALNAQGGQPDLSQIDQAALQAALAQLQAQQGAGNGGGRPNFTPAG